MSRMDSYIQEFVQKNARYGNRKVVRALFTGDALYAFISQPGYEYMENLEENIRDSVRAYTRDKDSVIKLYRLFVDFLKEKGEKANVQFPPVPVSNSFERQMYIAKYFHDSESDADIKIKKLEDILWVSPRTIEQDLKKLKGEDGDPIQVCGKQLRITDSHRTDGRIVYDSTMHPLFLTPNLTQVIVMLKGLKKMSEDPLYKDYALAMAADVWEQLSDYAKRRIDVVLQEILPDDVAWYKSLQKTENNLFYSEKRCSVRQNVILDCMKNGKVFCVEIRGEEGTLYYDNCKCVPHSYDGEYMEIETDQNRIRIRLSDVLRSAYSREELL